MANPKSQKDLFFAKLAQAQEAQAQAQTPRAPADAPRSANPDAKNTGVFVNTGVYHPRLGVIALTNGTDAGYIARKAMKFSNSNGELTEGQQALAAKQAISQAYTEMAQQIAQGMLDSGTPTIDITPENIQEFTQSEVLINLFAKCQLGMVLVNTNVERGDTIEVNQSSLANLFA